MANPGYQPRPDHRDAWFDNHDDQRGWAEPQRHHPEAVFVNAGGGETSIKSMTVPIILACTIAVAVAGLTYFGTKELGDIKHSISDLSRDIRSMGNDLTRRVESVERDVEVKARDRWTKTDHDLWCLRTEQINKDWRCGEGPPMRRDAFPEKKTTKPSWRPEIK